MDVLDLNDTRTDPATYKRTWRFNAQTQENYRDW
jgi:hypothetical protein